MPISKEIEHRSIANKASQRQAGFIKAPVSKMKHHVTRDDAIPPKNRCTTPRELIKNMQHIRAHLAGRATVEIACGHRRSKSGFNLATFRVPHCHS
jgi:hypothetical protein